MTNKEARQIISDIDKAYRNFTADEYKALDIAIEALEQEPKWIPVSDRFPQINEWVVCQCRANIYEVLKFTSYGWYHDDAHCYMSGFVIAWMPLLPSYQGE